MKWLQDTLVWLAETLLPVVRVDNIDEYESETAEAYGRILQQWKDAWLEQHSRLKRQEGELAKANSQVSSHAGRIQWLQGELKAAGASMFDQSKLIERQREQLLGMDRGKESLVSTIQRLDIDRVLRTVLDAKAACSRAVEYRTIPGTPPRVHVVMPEKPMDIRRWNDEWPHDPKGMELRTKDLEALMFRSTFFIDVEPDASGEMMRDVIRAQVIAGVMEHCSHAVDNAVDRIVRGSRS